MSEKIVNTVGIPDLPSRTNGLVVPIPTENSAKEAVNELLDSADEADMREILNTQGDLHERGSSEANAEANIAAAKTADEVAVTNAVTELESAFEEKLDNLADQILASPEVNDMIEAALEDVDLDVQTPAPSPVAQSIINRLIVAEQKIAAFEAILEEFKVRALAAFKHAGFKF